jgi:hypothetical protein
MTRLELLDQDGMTLFYDEILTAIRASTDDETLVASIIHYLRGGHWTAWAVWVRRDEKQKCCAILLTQPVMTYGSPGLHIFSLHGSGVKMDEWKEIFSQLEGYAREAGCKRITALTDNQRVLDITRENGMNECSYLEKELA